MRTDETLVPGTDGDARRPPGGEARRAPVMEGLNGAAPPVPDPEVVAKPTRRKFTAQYRLRILREADRCSRPGEVGRILRREGLYSSHLSVWRKARDAGALQGLTPRKRGAKPSRSNPYEADIRRLKAKVAALEKELTTARTIIAVQGKVAGLLGIRREDGKNA